MTNKSSSGFVAIRNKNLIRSLHTTFGRKVKATSSGWRNTILRLLVCNSLILRSIAVLWKLGNLYSCIIDQNYLTISCQNKTIMQNKNRIKRLQKHQHNHNFINNNNNENGNCDNIKSLALQKGASKIV